MKKSLLFLVLLLFSTSVYAVCPCPTSGTIGSNNVIIRNIPIVSAIDFTGAGEPTSPAALSYYLATATVVKISPAATFTAGQLYRHNAGIWELVLVAPTSTGLIGSTLYTYSTTWAQASTTPVLVPTQSVSSTNSTDYTNSVAQYVGTWTPTRSLGIVRQLVVLASNVSSGLGGTFIFEYGEDGSTAAISESRVIGDFATVRDFDLINAGAYFRVKFTPSRTVTSLEHVYITTTNRTQNDGAFVRLANQEIEEANAAMGQTLSCIKAFNSTTGKSINVRANPTGNLLVADFLTEVSKGTIPGHTLETQTAYNPSINSATPEVIWGAVPATYTFPAAAAVVNIISTATANDTSAGTGCRTITVEGLDANYLPVSQTVTLTTGVGVTTQTFLRFKRASCATAGSTGSNVGTITFTIAAGTQALIQPTYNATAVGYYTIPAGKTGYMVQVATGASQATAAAVATVRMFVREFGRLFQVRETLSSGATSSGTSIRYIAPFRLPEKADFFYEGTVSTNATAINVRFDILIVSN